MKFQKLLVSTLTGCVLVGASGAAMAVDCPEGHITWTTVPEITINGQPCFIKDVRVQGNVTITNSPSVTFFDNVVEGYLDVRSNEAVAIVGNTILGNDLPVEEGTVSAKINKNELAVVTANIISSSLTLKDNASALVDRNIGKSTLVCLRNVELDEFGNEFPIVECDTLDQFPD